MADVVLAGLSWVASPVIKKLLIDASTYLGVDVETDLQELETMVLPQFDLVIEAAEKSPHRDKLKAWLQKLKKAFYEAEDLLDEHEYNLLKRKAKNGKECSPQSDASTSIKAILKPFRAATSKASNLLLDNRRIISKINELKAILAEAKIFHELLGLPTGNITGRSSAPTTDVPPVTSLPPPRVFGRDKVRDQIIDLLTKKTAAKASLTGYSGITIVGHGGAGKSTLAQYVYNDDRVKEHFDVKMWVCISRKLDVHRHTQEIIESAANGECPRVNNLDTLHCKLREILQKSNKFLLVLDDVWFEESDNEKWEQLLAPLVSQQGGSKVLVTSRCNTLPAAICCEQVVPLENMDDAEFLALFKHHAFCGERIKDELQRVKLEEIAENIAKKLGQSPLAAKVVGSRLSKKMYISAWRDALRINNLGEPRRALLWSYEKLDPRLQRCFLYCSLFPKGHKFSIDDLVHLWVAEGFVHSCNQSSSLEDIGKDYVNQLVSGSFFQLVSDIYSGSWYIMHDLVHDLAESLSGEDCFRLEDDNETEIPSSVRHLSIRIESLKKHKKIICKLHHLRTIICIDPLIDDVSDVFHQILQNLKKLRVLYLSCYNSSMLPESVGQLKHLRYLNLLGTLISELPRSLGTLYHLELLQLNHKVKSLPDELCDLSKLRYLDGYEDRGSGFKLEKSIPQIPDIGKLTSLQRLREFSVQKTKGYELRQLRDMNHLGGLLKITNLENVPGQDEALESKLHRKSCLTTLKLVWSSENDMDAKDGLHLEILEGLKPPPQLENLTIAGYKSAMYPSWLLDGSYLENLKSFRLRNCSILESLPPNTELLRYCSELKLVNVPKLKTLPCLPPGLLRLTVSECSLLMFISNNELELQDRTENLTSKEQLTSQFALIWDVGSDSSCYINKALEKEHSSLEQMEPLMDEDISEHLHTIKRAVEEEKDEVLVKENIIRAWLYCHHQREKFLYGRTIGSQLVLPPALHNLYLSSCSITDGALTICLEVLTSLRGLSLENIMTLTALPSVEVFHHLTKLDRLDIYSCWYLRSLGGLRAATCLTEARFITCPSLELTHGAEFMPLSLRKLLIYNCMLAADSLCCGLPHLKKLYVHGCRTSASLSIGHQTSLTFLSLIGSPDLCIIEGLSSLQLQHLQLMDVPKLTSESISQFHVKESLRVSSSELLSHMLSAEGFTVPPIFYLDDCKEPSVSFEESANFSSVKHLILWNCEMKSLPRNMKCLSSLESLSICMCPNISSLPDLPSSLKDISIVRCSKLLEDSCRAPDGESWPKIAHIRWKNFR
ncbi:hypothetical protein ACP4OV_029395 [Aristida adscensionis]